MKKNYLILLSVLLLGACGKRDRADVRRDGDQDRQMPITGELSKSAHDLLTSEWVETCDHAQSSMMKELSQALDQRVQEIDDFSSKQPPSKRYKNVAFGESYLRDYVEVPERKDEWVKDVESWTSANLLYLKIKDQPVNADWIDLNLQVRSLLVNDEMRILDGMNMDLDHASGEKIANLQQVVSDCVKDGKCTKIELSEELKSFVEKNGIYSHYFRKLNNADSFESKRDYLGRFEKRVINDSKRYAFRVNETIQSSAKDGKAIYQLPIHASALSEEQKKQISSYVEPVWSDQELTFQLKWIDPVADTFHLIFNLNSPGTRAYVNFQDKEVHLFPGTRVKSVAHEFGHVLGFRDRYYTMWDQNQCKYIVEWNAMDIMSDSIGIVLPDEWKELKNHYLK